MVPVDWKPQWEIFVESAGIWGESDFIKNGFVDHINTTRDTTDYLWHTIRLVSLKKKNAGMPSLLKFCSSLKMILHTLEKFWLDLRCVWVMF